MLASVPIDPPFRVVLPGGAELHRGCGAPAFTVEFRTRRALADVVLRSALGFGEAYVRGDITVEGDLEALVRLGFELRERGVRGAGAERLKYFAGFLRRGNSRRGSRRNIAAHYDLANDFYELWLDKEMQYTCAYFADPSESLETAQLRKMDLVCRKLSLKPGQLVVEAGGGWGGLALHMAKHWGVRVVSFNISKAQVEFARARAQAHGLTPSTLDYVHDDYRNIPRRAPECDAFVSICMLEHVGRENYVQFLELVGRVLRPKGLAMLQFISRTAPAATPNPWLERHVFPGYYNPSMGEVLSALERSSSALQLVDLENMRFHYALTLRRWLDGLERNSETIRARWGEQVLRTYRLYLAGGLADFTRGQGTLVYQALFANGPDNAATLDRLDRFRTPKPLGAASRERRLESL